MRAERERSRVSISPYESRNGGQYTMMQQQTSITSTWWRFLAAALAVLIVVRDVLLSGSLQLWAAQIIVVQVVYLVSAAILFFTCGVLATRHSARRWSGTAAGFLLGLVGAGCGIFAASLLFAFSSGISNPSQAVGMPQIWLIGGVAIFALTGAVIGSLGGVFARLMSHRARRS